MNGGWFWNFSLHVRLWQLQHEVWQLVCNLCVWDKNSKTSQDFRVVEVAADSGRMLWSRAPDEMEYLWFSNCNTSVCDSDMLQEWATLSNKSSTQLIEALSIPYISPYLLWHPTMPQKNETPNKWLPWSHQTASSAMKNGCSSAYSSNPCATVRRFAVFPFECVWNVWLLLLRSIPI